MSCLFYYLSHCFSVIYNTYLCKEYDVIVIIVCDIRSLNPKCILCIFLQELLVVDGSGLLCCLQCCQDYCVVLVPLSILGMDESCIRNTIVMWIFTNNLVIWILSSFYTYITSFNKNLIYLKCMIPQLCCI